ncbi:RNA-binding domain-containing protein [Corynebacterium sp.]|uniref:RNA-binding domain-containing protein n=1 Tax=Corynebacterium sp. TaxID=1720 RepID=UPI0026DC68FB|nr:RNA-binding domain-containing protein [Corynebacterium sp.]MDO5032649.1 putative DNA binding domain-containing protein [Corynebacterium sp.]
MSCADTTIEHASLLFSRYVVVAELFQSCFFVASTTEKQLPGKMYNVPMPSGMDLLPTHVCDALDAIWKGENADAVESEVLEFKEDPAALPDEKRRGGNPEAAIIEKLIDESVCLANGDSSSGHIILGVSDKVGGPEGFSGTSMDPQSIEKKIFNGTKPNLRVEATEIEFHGTRLIVIRVPEALTFYQRTRGQASRRVGTSCEPVSEETRRAIALARANPDYSNTLSTRSVEDIDLLSLAEARRLLQVKRNTSGENAHVPETTLGLLRELGLLDESGRLKRAGEILLLPNEQPHVSIRHLWRSMIGAAPKVTEISAPLIEALPQILRLVSERGGQEIERIQLDNGQESAVPRFPGQAVDEAITNAVIHRDWQLTRPIVIEQSPRTLKIFSPGSLPYGVKASKLLTTPSIPRNGRLMACMRMLGLAEESSRGFDRMWAAMLRTGREVPQVTAEETYVEVVMSAGTPDADFVRSLQHLEEAKGHDAISNLTTLIVLWHLWHAPLITFGQVKEKTHSSDIESEELMNELEELDIITRVRDANEWVLSDFSRKAMGKDAAGELATISVQEWIEERLRAGEKLVTTDLAEETGLERREVTNVLRHLRTLGRAIIDPDGPQRGPRTRWIAP